MCAIKRVIAVNEMSMIKLAEVILLIINLLLDFHAMASCISVVLFFRKITHRWVTLCWDILKFSFRVTYKITLLFTVFEMHPFHEYVLYTFARILFPPISLFSKSLTIVVF